MIIPSDIVRHLKTYLPIFTDKFTDFLTIASASIGAGNILTVNSVAHGLSASKNIVISSGTVRNPLSASVLDEDNVRFTTKFNHDLIRPSLPGDDQTLILSGFGNVWDGEHQIIDVQSRESFSIALPSGETTAPAVDETQYLIEDRSAGLKGVQEVDTVPTADSFTVNITGVPELPIGPVDGLKIISGFRISAAADFNRAKAVYSKQPDGDAYLFVIMTDHDISKDRHTLNDAVAGFTRQDTMLLRTLQNFSTTVFLPTTNDLSGVAAQDEAYRPLYIALLASLFGFQEEDEAIQYVAVPAGSGPAEYNTAYYAHVYDWQSPGSLTYEDSFDQWPDVAFRDIAQTLKLFNDSEAEIKVNIDLDDEPV